MDHERWTSVPEVDTKILLTLNDRELFDVCEASEYFVNLCNETFWDTKLMKIYGTSFFKYKGIFSYREIYKRFRINSDKSLSEAVHMGLLPIVNLLVKTNVYSIQYRGNLPLIYAILSGSLDMVKILVENGAEICYGCYEFTNPSSLPLITAFHVGNLEVLIYLIERIRIINQQHRMGTMRLSSAAMEGSPDIMKYLDKQFNYIKWDEIADKALANHYPLSVIEFILNRVAPFMSVNVFLNEAISRNYFKAIKYLVETRTDILETNLTKVVTRHNVKVLKYLLEQREEYLSEQLLSRLLLSAVQYVRPDKTINMIKYIVKLGTNEKANMKALIEASKVQNSLEIVKYLRGTISDHYFISNVQKAIYAANRVFKRSHKPYLFQKVIDYLEEEYYRLPKL